MNISRQFDDLSPKTLFLIDSIGALVTAASLSLVLANFEGTFGVPATTLYILAGIAACFCVYSFSCFLFLKTVWRPFLRGIAVANAAYCAFTLGMVFLGEGEITLLGQLYFIGEAVIVAGLAFVEWKKS